jgi:alpha-tubulin suppressor-like RCC1 family protein
VNGAAWCWGSNSSVQLGNDSNTDSWVPVQVAGLTSAVTALASASDHSCALVAGGVRCWGRNFAGQLGNNSTIDSWVPAQVNGLCGAQ